MKIGENGITMQVMGSKIGWLLWRLLDAAPSADAEPTAIKS